MKKNLILSLFALVALCLGQQAKAQVSTAPVTVNIDLQAAVLSIALDAAPTVNFVYGTAAEYTASKTVAKPGHLTVISNKPYEIAVSADGLFTSSNSTNTTNLPALGIVGINIDPATLHGGSPTPVTALTQEDKVLVSGAVAEINAVYNVNYTITNPSSLISLPLEIYTTTVTYTATQL